MSDDRKSIILVSSRKCLASVTLEALKEKGWKVDIFESYDLAFKHLKSNTENPPVIFDGTINGESFESWFNEANTFLGREGFGVMTGDVVRLGLLKLLGVKILEKPFSYETLSMFTSMIKNSKN